MAVKRTTSFNPMTDRYAFDFKLCTYANGWAQFDSGQDASYYGTWGSPTERKLVAYVEGDISIETADTDAEYVELVRKWAEWANNGGWGPAKIDALATPELAAKFVALGLGDLLH